MKKIIYLLLISFLVFNPIKAAEIDPNAKGIIYIGTSKNLGLKPDTIGIKVCQVKFYSLENPYQTPVDPVDPTEPTDPVDPVDPADPTDPTDPVDPVEPTEPTEPTEPAEPTEEITEEGPFYFKDEFKGLIKEENTNDLEYYEKILKYIEDNNIDCPTYQTNHSGKLVLEDLDLGYYFIYIPTFKVENMYYVEQPVGVFLPTLENDNYSYNIKIYPKIDEEKTLSANYHETPPPENPITENELPETGTNMYLVPIFLITGIILIIIGRILIHEKRDR